MNVTRTFFESASLYKKSFVALGLLLILASGWFFSAIPKQDWSDTQWERHLSGKEWIFSRHDGTLVADGLVLSFFGKIRGYDHPHERRWEVKHHALELIGEDGEINSRFPLSASSPASELHLIQLPESGPHELQQTGDQKNTFFALCLAMGLMLLIGPFWRTPQFATRLYSYLRQWAAPANFKPVAWVVLAIWFFIACTLASMPAYVPDEAWFLFEAVMSAQRVLIDHAWLEQLVFHPNTVGYGGVWWSIYTGMTLILHGLLNFLRSPEALAMTTKGSAIVRVQFWENVSPTLASPMVLMRFLALLSLAAFGALLVRHARTAAAAMLCAVMLVTLPIAWWSGKLASPELLSASIFAVAVIYWFVLHKAIPALLLATLAVAMKLTVTPVYLVLLVFVFRDLSKASNRSLPRLALYGFICLMVFLLCNLWLLYSPQAGIEQLMSLSRFYHPDPDWHVQSSLVLFLHAETWEGTNYGSLSYWSGGLALIAASFIVELAIDRRLALFLLAGVGAQYLFMMTQPFHCWYWFPIILAALVPFSQLRSETAITVAVILLISLWPFEFTQRELSYKALHLMELQEVARQKTCIAQKLSEFQPDIVFDMASIGTLSSQSIGGKWKTKDYHDSYVAISAVLPNADSGQKRILILGEKSRFTHDFLHAASNRPDKLLGNCGSIQFVKI